jgi:hypothetical protein
MKTEEEMKNTEKLLVIPDGLRPSEEIVDKIKAFLDKFDAYEEKIGIPLVLMLDAKSKAYYTVCHLESKTIAAKADTDAVLDPEESEDYKLNRGLYTDNYAYKLMESDAKKGRSFEDIVTEYDDSYRPTKPLKVYGGQHRVLAIKEAVKEKVDSLHGVRVYYGLSTEERFEIASVNNTSIAVSNDLLDRMQEDLLGPELRRWSQSLGLLGEGQNFADRRSSEGIPTVRIARSIILNYYLGKGSKIEEWHEPVVCASGPRLDARYQDIREQIEWGDRGLVEMGEEFAVLHKAQRAAVLNRAEDKYMEFANKAIHPTVASSWAYAAGLLQVDRKYLDAHYAIAVSVKPPNDPLNAKALVQARFEGMDPDTYRGLGSRISGDELGRMLQVFILQATKAQRRGISKQLANAAIKSFEAQKQQILADKAVKRI